MGVESPIQEAVGDQSGDQEKTLQELYEAILEEGKFEESAVIALDKIPEENKAVRLKQLAAKLKQYEERLGKRPRHAYMSPERSRANGLDY